MPEFWDLKFAPKLRVSYREYKMGVMRKTSRPIGVFMKITGYLPNSYR